MNPMRWILLLALVVVPAFCGAPGVQNPIPELRLKDGRVLHDVQFRGIGISDIMAEWQGGHGIIQYADLPSDLAAQIREFAPDIHHVPTPTSTTPPRQIVGQVRVRTKTGGYETFAGEHLAFYRLADWNDTVDRQRLALKVAAGESVSMQRQHVAEAWLEAVKPLKAVVRVETDAQGEFTADLPAGDFFVFCACQHLGGNVLDHPVWAEPVTSTVVQLNPYNVWAQIFTSDQ